MANPLTAALAGGGKPVRPVFMVPVTVTGTDPLLVDLGGGPVAGVGIAGLTYTLGAAVALVFEGGSPLVLPIGE